MPSPLSVPADKLAPVGTPEITISKVSEPSVSVSAEETLRKSIVLNGKVVAEFPDSPSYRLALAGAYLALALRIIQTGDEEEAAHEYAKAVSHLKKLAHDFA